MNKSEIVEFLSGSLIAFYIMIVISIVNLFIFNFELVGWLIVGVMVCSTAIIYCTIKVLQQLILQEADKPVLIEGTENLNALVEEESDEQNKSN
jgi:ABC-type bacteriocin/lantibiotic exporter with double-glycine peptidase domain